MLQPDPNNIYWAKDTEKLSYKLLSKMGWTPGKGLGAKEDGKVDFVQVQIKNDKLGIGVERDTSNNWIASTIEFNSVLSRLVPFSNSFNDNNAKPPQNQQKAESLELKIETTSVDPISETCTSTSENRDDDNQRKRKRRRIKGSQIVQNTTCETKAELLETPQPSTQKETHVQPQPEIQTQQVTQPQTETQIQIQTQTQTQRPQVKEPDHNTETKKAHNHFIPKRVRRGKEVRNYSKEDLSAIFGFSKEEQKAQEKNRLVEDPTLQKSNRSMTDYFEGKLKEIHLKRKRSDGDPYYQDVPSFSI